MIEYLSLSVGVIGLIAISLYLGGRLFLLTASIAVSDPKPITKTWSLLDGFKSYKVLWTYLLTLLPFIIINIFTVSQLFSGIDWSALQNAEEFAEHLLINKETINHNTLMMAWISVPLSIIGSCISSQLLGDIYKKLNG